LGQNPPTVIVWETVPQWGPGGRASVGVGEAKPPEAEKLSKFTSWSRVTASDRRPKGAGAASAPPESPSVFFKSRPINYTKIVII